jgi:hypothetical protein
MNQKCEHKYKLLKDEAKLSDSSANQTHENIAENLFKLITDNNSDFNIGLEGSWGSGKSTIISILKEKFKDNKEIFYFYFDAWEHEGDPLRRIFLEEMIKQETAKNKSEKLEELSNKISNRQKTVITKTTQSATGLGTLLAITTFFVPLGAAILSNIKLSDIRFALYLEPAWWLILGLIFCVAPLIVLCVNFIKLTFVDKVTKALDPKHWSFLEKESLADIKQEISEAEERSSIEFAKYFNEILTEFKNKKYEKLLIVIDNLDRVDPQDSLKIWSTLQTFFQNRNPILSKENNQIKIYFIVPFDREGLSKLWGKKTLNEEKPQNVTVPKSFFNKCFQLIVPVPPLTHNAWEGFLDEKLKESLNFEEINPTELQKKFKQDIINIFKKTREKPSDIPSYREIINFVNQVNWLRASANQDISNTGIGYFAIYKYLRFQSTEEIIRFILDDEKKTFDLEQKKHIAGLIYGVSPEKGMEILLGKEIEKHWSGSIDNFELRPIALLEENFENAFWTQLEIFLKNKETSIDDLLKLALFIKLKEEFRERSDSAHNWLLDEMKRHKKENRSYRLLENYLVLEMYKNLFQISIQQEGFINYFQNILAKPFSYQILSHNHDSISFSLFIKLFDALHRISNKLNYHIEPQELTLPLSDNSGVDTLGWLNFAKEVFNSKTEIYKYLYPPSSLVGKLSESYNSTFVEKYLSDLHHLLRYFFECKSFYQDQELNWDNLLTLLKYHACQYYVNDDHAKSFYLALIELFKLGHDLTSLLNSDEFQDYIANNQEFIKYPALLYLAFNVSGDTPVTSSIVALQSFWRKENNDNNDLNFIFNHLEFIDNFEALWNLFKDLDSIRAIELIKRVIDNFDQEKYLKIFSDQSLDKLNKLITSSKDATDNENFCRFFIEKVQIQENLVDESLDLAKYDESLYELVRTYSSEDKPEFFENLKNKLENLSQDQWRSALDEKCKNPKFIYLTSLALEIQKKDTEWTLKTNYHDALLDFVKDLLNEQKSLSDWQKKNIESLNNLMNEDFLKKFREEIIKFILESLKDLNITSLELYELFIDFTKLVSEKHFQDYFENILKSSLSLNDLEKIYFIYDKAKFKQLPKDLKTRVEDRIGTIYSTQAPDEQALLKNISDKLGVKINGHE